jgi:hypothetical protein
VEASGVPLRTPIRPPGEILELVRVAMVSLSFSFLKMLFGMRCFSAHIILFLLERILVVVDFRLDVLLGPSEEKV